MVYGAPGAGKTYFAEQFSEKFRAPFINTTNLRRQIFKKPSFNTTEDKEMQLLSNCVLGDILRSGVMVLLEGGIDTRQDRKRIITLANEAGYQPLLVWVQTDPKTTKSRARAAHMAAKQFDEIVNKLETPQAAEKPIVISGKHTFDTQVRVILRQLSAQRAQNLR